MCILPPTPLLRIPRTSFRPHPANRCAGLTTEIGYIAGLVPQPVRIEKINRIPKRRKRATKKMKTKKRKVTARGTTAMRVCCYIPQRKGLCIPPRRNATAFRHHFRQMRTPRRGTSWTSAAIHLPDATVPRDLGPPHRIPAIWGKNPWIFKPSRWSKIGNEVVYTLWRQHVCLSGQAGLRT